MGPPVDAERTDVDATPHPARVRCRAMGLVDLDRSDPGSTPRVSGPAGARRRRDRRRWVERDVPGHRGDSTWVSAGHAALRSRRPTRGCGGSSASCAGSRARRCRTPHPAAILLPQQEDADPQAPQQNSLRIKDMGWGRMHKDRLKDDAHSVQRQHLTRGGQTGKFAQGIVDLVLFKQDTTCYLQAADLPFPRPGQTPAKAAAEQTCRPVFTLLTTGYGPTVEISFQYVCYNIPFLFLAAAIALALMGQGKAARAKQWGAVGAMAVATLLATNVWGTIPPSSKFKGGFASIGEFKPLSKEERQKARDLRELAAMVPKKAVLAVSEQEYAHVSSRLDCLDLRDGYEGADYILYAENTGGFGSDQRHARPGQRRVR